MPRAPAKIRKRFIEGTTEVLDWETEECLLYGYPLVFDTLASMRSIDDWRAAWSRWRDVVLPKCIEHRPGTRPVAMYVCGGIPRRELRINTPETAGWKHIDVRDRNGKVVRHWLDAPTTFLEPEAAYLYRLGIIDGAELRRHKAWLRKPNPECGTCTIDTYPLEMSLHE